MHTSTEPAYDSRLTTSDSRLRVGVDIGGTFTDLVIYDDDTGEFVVGKTLTTPDDPSRGIETGLADILAAADAAMATVGQIIHGTTLVTNALIERKGAPTALLTSEGFRDSLEIGREHRYDLYDLQLEMPRPLVPRELRFPVPGRTLANGATLDGHDLDEAYVERLARELVDNGIEAVAIAFLNSFANPELERRAKAAVLRAAPELRVALSSDVVPEIREYERTSTTVANVYVQARVERYLRDLEERLARLGFQGALLLLISSGAAGDGRDRGPVSGASPGVRTRGRRAGGRRLWRRGRVRATFFPLIWAARPPSSPSSIGESHCWRTASRSTAATASRRAPGCRSTSR